MATNSTSYQQRKLVRIPLVGNAQNRDGTTDKDQKFVNCYPETTKNVVTNTKKLYVVKRPGYVLDTTVSAGEGRGVWYWNSIKYSVVDDVLYQDTTPVLTLKTTTGMCGATDFFGEGGHRLFLVDGEDGYIINEDNTIELADKAFLRWTSGETVELGDRRIKTALPHTYYYRAIVAGTCGTSEPSWPTTIGATIIDGEVTWECRGAYEGATKFATNTAYSIGDLVTPITENSLYYKVTATSGSAPYTSGGSEPTWPVTIGETVVSNELTFECVGWYGGFPSPHVPTPVYLDGYIALSEANTVDIYNSGIHPSTTQGLPDSWNPLDYYSANQFPDNVVALARQNNWIVAMGENNMEFLYDNANTPGSPFERNQGITFQSGLINARSFTQSERAMMFVSKSDAGRPSVWLLDGTNSKEISTEYQERLILKETGEIFCNQVRIDGHFFFIVTLPVLGKSLVYDIEEQMWHEWSALPFSMMTFDGTDILFQHQTDGNIYKMSNEIYQDNGVDFTVTIQMAKQDLDNQKRKFIQRIDVIGDQSTTTIGLSWSDDDYQTWNNPFILSMYQRPYVTRCGSFRRRAWRIEQTDNAPLRLEALEVVYTQGEH